MMREAGMMSNEEYYHELYPRVDELKALRKKGKDIAARIVGNVLMKEDLFFCASADRCISLIDGFISMLNERNLTCSGVLLRIEMDNCMRTYATFIAEDMNAIIDCIIQGDRIDKQKSKDGNILKDWYLKDQLTKLDSRFAVVYDQACGYIHLSSKAFYQTVRSCNNNVLEWQIGASLLEKYNSVLIEAADSYIHFTELHYRLLGAVADSKERIESNFGLEVLK